MYRKRKFRRNVKRTRGRVTRRSRPTRTYRRRTTLRRLSRRVSSIARNFQPEFKWEDYDLHPVNGELTADAFAIVTASPTLGTNGLGSAPGIPGYYTQHIPGVVQGDGAHERVGQQILYRAIHVTGIISAYTAVSGGQFQSSMTGLSGYVKIMVVLDTQARVGVNTDIMPYLYGRDSNSDYSIAARRNVYVNNRFQVLASRTYAISMGDKPNKLVNIYIPMRRVMHYGGDAGADQLNQRFYVIALAGPTLDLGAVTPAAPQFAMRLQARVRYIDS